MAATEKQITSLGKSHQEWRREVKKLRRQRFRRTKARERDRLLAEDEKKRLEDPEYRSWCEKQEELELFCQKQEEEMRQENEEKWLRQELLAQKAFRGQEKVLQAEKAERLRIQKEFEEFQLEQKRLAEEQKYLAEEKRRRHERLMEKIQDYVQGLIDLPEELLETADTNPGKLPCPFFIKTGTCRFGDKCNQNHSRPGISRIILFRHFFSHICLEQSKNTEYGNDFALEFSESEMNNEYRNFFEDVVPEMEKFGKLVNFRTCRNYEPHVRGNVYVEFSEERDALRAYQNLQGRYYARKRINAEFCAIQSWKSAICGLSLSKRCPKGKNCNFLHVFNNPKNRYNCKVTDQLQDSVRSRNSIGSVRGNGDDQGWNEGDYGRTKRNWRWSETPERSKTPKNRSRASSKESSRWRRSNSRESRRSNPSIRSSHRKRSRSRSQSNSSRHSRETRRRNGKSKSRSREKKSKRHRKSKKSKTHKRPSKSKERVG